MQKQIGITQFFQRCLEGLDQVGGKLPDKTYRIRNKDFLMFIQPEAPCCGIQRVKEAVVGRDVGIREQVNPKRFAVWGEMPRSRIYRTAFCPSGAESCS